MKAYTITALTFALAGAGCTTVAEQRERDVSEVGNIVHERTGYALAARPGDDGSMGREVLDLLEGPLTEEAAVKIALLNNRAVRAALADLGVASAELVQAGLLSNPVFVADAKFFESGTEVELGLAESLFDIFFLSARKRIAASEFEATKVGIVREIVRLTHDVRRAFVGVRAARQLVQVEAEVLRASNASVDLMTELHRAGNVTDPELTTEQVSLARARLGVARAEAAAVEERESLNVLLGLWGDSIAWTVEGTLPEDAGLEFDFDLIETRAITASLDLAEIRARATAHARRAGIVGWEAVFAPGEVGLSAKREASNEEWGLGPALGFSLPVFDAGGPRRAAAASLLEESLSHHIAVAVEVRSAARRLRERSIALRDQARFIREEELPKAKRLVRETLRNYNAMQVGVFAVLIAKQNEIDAARNYVTTLRETWMAQLDIEELVAGSLNAERVSFGGPKSISEAQTTSMQGPH